MKRPAALLLVALLAGGCDGAAVTDTPASRTSAVVGVAANDAALPTLTGRVVDHADLLSPPTEQSLAARLEALERQTSDQFVVVTLESLGGDSIEETGLRLGNGWGIGGKDRDNGVLLIVAPNERKVRIEVGHGLEGTLTNALCSRIIDEAILPRFRQGDMESGIVAGTDAVIAALSGKGQAA